MFDYQNPTLPGRRDFFLCKTFSQIDDRDNLAAQVDDALDVIWRVGNSSDLRHAHDFMQRSDGHAVSLVSQLKPDNVQFAIHVGDNQLRTPAAACRALPLAPVFSSRRPIRRSICSSANRSMESSSPRDIFDICSAEAANSVEPEVVCCTSSRMRSMALTTACAPEACSSTAELIS